MTGRLDELQESIETLSDDALHKLIIKIRSDRTTKKTSIKAERAAKKEGDKNLTAARKLLSNLTAEQIKEMLRAK